MPQNKIYFQNYNNNNLKNNDFFIGTIVAKKERLFSLQRF